MSTKRFPLTIWLMVATALVSSCGGGAPDGRTNLLIVIDGLRPDYITPELMPHLHELGERGVFAEAHTAAFPSITRVNSASISTGSYPARHGLIGNTMLVRAFFEEPFSTGSARTLRRLAALTEGHLLGAPTLAELLQPHGMRLFVTGSGGSGNSMLHSPHAHADSSIWTAGGFFVPADARREAVAAVGDLVRENPGRTVWAFDAYLHKALSADPPEVVVMWINEPDAAGHRYGVGAPETLRAVANVDAQIGRVVAALEENGSSDRVNVFVTTDHGYSTSRGGFSVRRTLARAGLGVDDVTVVGSMVFLERDDSTLLSRVVEALQRDVHTGNIYTRPTIPGSNEGSVPGTLSTAVVQWDHERSADVIATPVWSDEVNEFGFAGASSRGGTAGHGSDSPYDMQIRLVAAGPDIQRGVRSHVPSGNVDLAPTLLHLLGLEPPATMSGRVLHELLREGPEPDQVQVHHYTHRAAVRHADGLLYEAELHTLQVDSTVYLRGARTTREEP